MTKYIINQDDIDQVEKAFGSLVIKVHRPKGFVTPAVKVGEVRQMIRQGQFQGWLRGFQELHEQAMRDLTTAAEIEARLASLNREYYENAQA